MLCEKLPTQSKSAIKYQFWCFLVLLLTFFVAPFFAISNLNYNSCYAQTSDLEVDKSTESNIKTSIKKSKNKDLQAKFKDWSVFKSSRGEDVICYAVSLPIKQRGNFLFRGEPYLMITNLVNDSDEVSVSSGFIYKQTTDVELSFGSKKFYLFPYEALAWANDNNDDIDIIKEMQRNEELTITGTMRDNKTASDTYSLIGFDQAYAKLKEICK